MSVITDLTVKDIRFPTSLSSDGSDAHHPDPDYSCVYVNLYTDEDKYVGCGLSFTIGRGNELVRHAVDSLRFLVVGQKIKDIQDNMGEWVHGIANDGQLRWLGPEKGVMALAVAAIINAFWDLWAKMENKSVWKLVADMSPERFVSLVDFKYIQDVVTKAEALDMLKANEKFKAEREAYLKANGFPAYTTQVGWLGYSDEKIRRLSKHFKDQGFHSFKMKVGNSLEDDKRRLRVLRECIGDKDTVMVDANQKWDVQEAIDWMKELAPFNLTWIEEPTSPDDILGHKAISDALKPLGIGVATGEMCQNKVMFKQFLQSGAMQYCQIDSARMGGLNEVLAVYLMAAKLKVPVCPHAGGVGLCEMVQHLQVIDYVCLTGTFDNRVVEYVDHLHEHFLHPPVTGSSTYFLPDNVGYSTEMRESSIESYEYPHGRAWKKLVQEGKYSDPSLKCKKFN